METIKAFQIIDHRYFISQEAIEERGGNRKTIENNCSLFNMGKSAMYAYLNSKDPSSKRLFLFDFLPVDLLKKLGLPTTRDEFVVAYENQEHSDLQNASNKTATFIWVLLKEAFNNDSKWKSFIPYYNKYILTPACVIAYAKTHSVFHTMQGLLDAGYSSKQLFDAYVQLDGTTFHSDNAEYFAQKLRVAKCKGIPETLIHQFILHKRENYKLTKLHQKRIKFYYCLKYSSSDIAREVNIEMMDRGLQPISKSTVKRFLNQPEIKNTCDPIRYGNKYAEENIYSYLTRQAPDRIARVLQIDSTQLQIPYSSDRSCGYSFLQLLVVMDVFSRRIIGHALAETENTYLLLEGLKDALINLKYMPNEIVHDNHKNFFSQEFKSVANKLMSYGIDFRPCRVGNPSDKGHVERWFRTFQEKILKGVFGFMGEGIRSKSAGARPSREMEVLFTSKENLRDRQALVELVNRFIEDYNNLEIDGRVSPNQKFDASSKEGLTEFKRHEIIDLFWKSKTLKISNSMVQFNLNRNRHSYTIDNRYLANKLNGRVVLVRYDESDLSSIAVFDRYTNEFVCDLGIDHLINVASSLHTTKDKSLISKHYNRIQRIISENNEELVREIEDSELELSSIPTIKLNPPHLVKRILEIAEKKVMLSATLKTKDRSPIKRKAETSISQSVFQSSSNELFGAKGTMRELNLSDEKEH